MRRPHLHLNALRAFESAARLSGFSRAADELNISHSTISHHIKGLENALGVDLFIRRNRKVVLTNAGEALFPVLKSSFDQISISLDKLQVDQNKRALKVTMTPSFANKWLVPRLRSFQKSYPDIEVQLQPSLDLLNFNRDDINVGIRTGLGEWPGMRSELLMPVHMTPFCSPKLLEAEGNIVAVEDLRKFTLLHADVSLGIGFESEWREWLKAMGAHDVVGMYSLSFHDPGLALQAAVDGLGIAMGYAELAVDDVASGRLVRPFTEEILHPWSYYIVTVEGDNQDNHTSRFCEWLRDETRTT